MCTNLGLMLVSTKQKKASYGASMALCGQDLLMKQSKAVTSTQYWAKIRLPLVFDELNMQQLTALRLMVQKAFNEGKKSATR